MPSLNLTAHFNAAPERVFAVFTDFENAPRNIAAIKRVEILTDGPVGKGTRFRETRLMFKKEATETLEVTAFEPPHFCVIEGDSCGAHWRTEFRFIGEEAERTRIEVNMTIKAVTFLAKIMSPLSILMMGPMRKCIEQDMADLRGCLESPSAEAGQAGPVVASGQSG